MISWPKVLSQKWPFHPRIATLLLFMFLGAATESPAQSPPVQLMPGTYQFKIRVASLESATGSWQLDRGGAFEPISNFAGFEDLDPTFNLFMTDIAPGDVSITFRTEAQVIVVVNNVQRLYTLASLGRVTVESARASMNGWEPGSPDGTSSWHTVPYDGSWYPAGTTIAQLVDSTIGMTATKPDWGYPYSGNSVGVTSGAINGYLTVPPPVLTLFLDLNGFTASNWVGTDDKASYIPGALSNGTSLPLAQMPQRIHVVAAYVNYLAGC